MWSRRRILVYIAAALLILLLVLFIYHYREKMIQIIVPFFMAMIIAYLLHPLVIRLEKRRLPRMAGILLIYLLFSLLAGLLVVFVVPELIENTKELMNTLPEIIAKYQQDFNTLMSAVRSSNWSPDVKEAIFREIQGNSLAVQSYITELLKKSLATLVKGVEAFFDMILAMIVAYYFIKDAEFFKESTLSLTPRRWRNGIIGAGREINLILSNFIQGQLLTALIVGSMETIGLLLVRTKYPIVLGLVGGIANIIPYFGPILGAIPAIAIALIESPVKALWTTLVFVIVQQIDNAFISPKIIEGKLGLHPVTTIFAVLVGGEFFGIIGMLVSVPVLAILKVIVKRVIEAIV